MRDPGDRAPVGDGADAALGRAIVRAVLLALLSLVLAIASILGLEQAAAWRAGGWREELLVHLGALLVPVTLLPLLHAARGIRRALEARGMPIVPSGDEFAAACAGADLPPGCFVVRRRGAGPVALVLTPAALLAREDGASYRRVPWAHVGAVELGSADPHEPISSDTLAVRDGAGNALAELPCGELGLPADAVLEVVRRYWKSSPPITSSPPSTMPPADAQG